MRFVEVNLLGVYVAPISVLVAAWAVTSGSACAGFGFRNPDTLGTNLLKPVKRPDDRPRDL
jgi:hypothetical protein